MKVFLSALENGANCYNSKKPLAEFFVDNNIKFKYNLMSYYYIKNKNDLAEFIRDNSQEILIDSGAHSLQKGKKVNWLEYTKQYADFIKRFDKENVIGYFEMDVDNIIGYDKVLELRKILESVSNKIIPVWHKNRGIDEYKKMCQKYQGKIVAITGFKNEDIKDEQYLMFLKYAKKYNCKVHCLGMTRKKVLDKVPFDYVDSSSWKQSSIFGRVDGRGKVTREFSKINREIVFMENYKLGIKMQEHYYKKWKSVCKD
jgi:hypothetical protein